MRRGGARKGEYSLMNGYTSIPMFWEMSICYLSIGHFDRFERISELTRR